MGPVTSNESRQAPVSAVFSAMSNIVKSNLEMYLDVRYTLDFTKVCYPVPELADVTGNVIDREGTCSRRTICIWKC